MLSAKEAKQLTLFSDHGLSEVLEEIEEAIKEEANYGSYELEWIVEELEPYILDKVIEELKIQDFSVVSCSIECVDYLEDNNITRKWYEKGIKISWRLA